MSVHSEIKKVTTETLRKMKFDKEKITMLTAYDYTTAKMVKSQCLLLMIIPLPKW